MYYYRWSKEYLEEYEGPREGPPYGDGKCETMREAKFRTTLECPELNRKSRWEQLSDNGWGRTDGKISLVLSLMEITAITI